MLIVNKPQFNTTELSVGEAVYIQSNRGTFYNGKHCLITNVTPLTITVMYHIIKHSDLGSNFDSETIDIDQVVRKEIKIRKMKIREEE